jgi:hypothetical protein
MRRAVVVLLCGWYLLLPPTTGKPVFPLVDTDAPLIRWTQIGSFDSAKDCSNEQGEHGLELTKPNYHESFKGQAAQYIQSLCIASDDPRLKGR